MLDWQDMCCQRSAMMRLTFGLVVAVLLVATNVTSGIAGTLNASWPAPTTNTDGSRLTDLAAYRIYYGTGSAPCPGPSVFQMASASSSPGTGEAVGFRLTGLAGG